MYSSAIEVPGSDPIALSSTILDKTQTESDVVRQVSSLSFLLSPSDRSSRKSNEILWHVECRLFLGESFHTCSITRLPTDQTNLSNLLSRCQTSTESFREQSVSVFTENFGAQRKQNGKYQKSSPLFQTMIDLFRSRMFIEYPVLFICLSTDENRMLEDLLKH